ncbi:MAG TPA: transaldolase [Acidimicrobiia bacterium]|nr:transaldolase [Acidimicrobiia bacterium]
MPISNLHGLAASGVSVWSDQISRRMLDTGELARRVEQDAVTGVTSNPTIFASAIGGSDDYKSQLDDLRSTGMSTQEIVKNLMAGDIKAACDVLAPVHTARSGRDGFVSVEVSPTLAGDTEATVAEARDWVKQIDRENLLVKVPATAEGVPAIRALIAEGISINVTLIFSLQRYGEVINAYMEGLERLTAVGGDLSTVTSVASFFVSRFDSEVDRRLDEVSNNDANDLKGHLAVANARAAYGLFLEEFSGPRFEALSEQGARPQKPLWASTSTKNPAYSDLLYVESLVATDTVNTMPLETMDAYQDHGDPEPSAFDAVDIVRANDQLDKMAELGIDYQDVVDTLEREGVEKFTASWNELLEKVEKA